MILKALAAALLIVMGIAALVAGGGLTLGGYFLIQRSAEMVGMFILMIGLGSLVMGGRFVIEGGRQLQ